MEYMRRGRPLKKTGWTPELVCRFMRVFLKGKNRDDDLGAWGKMFPDTPSGPCPLPDYVLEAEEEEKRNVSWMT